MKQLELSDLGNREVIRKNSVKSEEIVKIPINKVVIREGFNVRKDFGDMESLAASIKESGQQQPGRVDVLKNGTFALVDGHRRYMAIKQYKVETYFKAIVNTSKTTEETRLIQMFITQDNKHLTPSECAEIIQRLIVFGLTQQEIAKRIGKSPGYVSNMISFAREDQEIKDLVAQGKTTVSTVLKAKNTIKNKTERNKILTEAAATGKVTSEDILPAAEIDRVTKAALELSEEFGLVPDRVEEILRKYFK